ncbi:DEAD/DEAH box helicase [Sarcina ventriculi]|uniref:DEAD/DEAH box helicase n=1 Tax=Sarcina ventriculi TaxID=1267 RepID=UPI00073ED9B8|nr:ATP-binding domain-containing protein [Sarcina ventriculi]
MLEVVRGATQKVAYSEKLITILEGLNIDGIFYVGYPIIGGMSIKIDAMLLSEKHGMVIFTINQNNFFEDKTEEHDIIYNNIEGRLKKTKELTLRRDLKVDINIVEFAPTWNMSLINKAEDFIACNENTIGEYLNKLNWQNKEYYNKLVESIQLISQLKKKDSRNYILNDNSRGGRLRKVEAEISSLDHCQSKAVIETVHGVQRIRGLAGSGKTIVLALKVAYLYSIYEDKTIAVTFNTRSLKRQFEILISKFIIENTSEEPDWSRIKIIQAWGSTKSEGLYYKFCLENNKKYYDLSSAKEKYGKDQENIFDLVCEEAIKDVGEGKPLYDVILVDEAQDFSKYFLRMCYKSLPHDNKMLVYAYDELQSLNDKNIEAPEELFGFRNGIPLVSLKNEPGKPTEDVILYKCYRNSKPILTTAHSLGFGIYRNEGLVQLFEDKKLWEDIGYELLDGEIQINDNENVKLSRTEESSPKFLEEHSPIDDLLIFKKFNTIQEEAEWVVSEIVKNIQEDELKYSDIMIIHPDPLTIREYVSQIKIKLSENKINSHIAGHDTSPDEFNKDDSITISQIYRAKGNEASMIYFINADKCYNGINLAKKRNILFTGITRSKAWVRVTGVGDKMSHLIDEYNEVKKHNFELDFKYPDEEQRAKLRIIHRDKTKSEQDRIKMTELQVYDIISRLKRGEIQKEDLSEDLLNDLKDVVFGEL